MAVRCSSFFGGLRFLIENRQFCMDLWRRSRRSKLNLCNSISTYLGYAPRYVSARVYYALSNSNFGAVQYLSDGVVHCITQRRIELVSSSPFFPLDLCVWEFSIETREEAAAGYTKYAVIAYACFACEGILFFQFS